MFTYQTILSLWKQHIPGDLKPYWFVRDELSVCNDLLLYGKRIVVPISLQTFTLLWSPGNPTCCLRARNAVWWPGLAKQILSMVQNCHICSQRNPLVVEPMISSELAAYHPWQRVSSDLFELKGNKYLLVGDSFSRNTVNLNYICVEVSACSARYSKRIC